MRVRGNKSKSKYCCSEACCPTHDQQTQWGQKQQKGRETEQGIVHDLHANNMVALGVIVLLLEIWYSLLYEHTHVQMIGGIFIWFGGIMFLLMEVSSDAEGNIIADVLVRFVCICSFLYLFLMLHASFNEGWFLSLILRKFYLLAFMVWFSNQPCHSDVLSLQRCLKAVDTIGNYLK